MITQPAPSEGADWLDQYRAQSEDLRRITDYPVLARVHAINDFVEWCLVSRLADPVVSGGWGTDPYAWLVVRCREHDELEQYLEELEEDERQIMVRLVDFLLSKKLLHHAPPQLKGPKGGAK